MGRKPLVALAGVCLAGVVLCGCSGRQCCNNRRSTPPSSAQVPPAPAPAPGTVTNATGWDNSPAKSVGGSMNAANPSDLRAPAGSLTAGPGALPAGGSSSPSSWNNTGSGLGSRTGSGLGGMPASGSSGGLNGMPPSPPGSGLGTGLGASSSSSTITPPPPPAQRPASMGNTNSDFPATPTGANQSNMTGGYRSTVPPGLGSDQPSTPAMPSPVPTMPGNTLQP